MFPSAVSLVSVSSYAQSSGIADVVCLRKKPRSFGFDFYFLFLLFGFVVANSRQASKVLPLHRAKLCALLGEVSDGY